MLRADWNPASDMQALARVWRDGQKKDCASCFDSISLVDSADEPSRRLRLPLRRDRNRRGEE